MDREKRLYLLIRMATYPFGFLPLSWIRAVGSLVGFFLFHFMTKYRKRVLSNLSLAKDLHLSHRQLLQYAKQSFQNLAINCLEYPKFAQVKDLSRFIQCENPEVAEAIYHQGKGIIFFCGHQSNWEALFLDGTARMRGVAIGRPIKNKWLYDWILSIREKYGGKIITPRNALKEGLKALREGKFLGIVGDQGMPDSGYSFPFLGRRAWSSTAPALLACKTQCPIIFASTKRVAGGYRIHYHDPVFPDPNAHVEKEVIRMMDQVLFQLQESIHISPGEWLWQHNRWKQQTTRNLYRRFRQDCLCIILEEHQFDKMRSALEVLKEIYPLAFIALFVPETKKEETLIEVDEIVYYRSIEETLVKDFRFKLVFNFTSFSKIKPHFEALSAFEVLDLQMLQSLAQEHLFPSHTLKDVLQRSLCRPGSIWQKKESEHAC